ncbi:ABC transporter ATP-binding protein [Halorussus salinisoli]|uniref:ABC transporter ATP-binding protein n=1 Tax=Halorussus salinisoli TaxID=2558242 RepID=UPI001485ABB5|nr:ABC transporter ATP-binding protein [Halorussus salinisoli]
MSEPLLEVEDLTIQYEAGDEWLTAASDASFTIRSGEYFGLVGESGCGKSTIAKSIIGGLDENGEIASGTIKYKGQEVQDLSLSELNDVVGWDEIAYIPQSSMNSIDPLERIKDQAIEIAKAHTDYSDQEALARFKEMFEIVGIPESRISDYPHQFSGGMQQRAIIALALFLEPSLIVADEPTTALDVIMQDQIFKYYDRVREELNTSMLLITHDISVVFESCDRMAVMHGGQIAETGTVTDVYEDPRHPYSMMLQEAFPDIRHPNRRLENIEGKPPQTFGDIDYCTFSDRCPYAIEDCERGAPPLELANGARDQTEIAHQAACIRKHELDELARESENPATFQEESDD